MLKQKKAPSIVFFFLNAIPHQKNKNKLNASWFDSFLFEKLKNDQD